MPIKECEDPFGPNGLKVRAVHDLEEGIHVVLDLAVHEREPLFRRLAHKLHQ
jgi:hypothetical protein